MRRLANGNRVHCKTATGDLVIGKVSSRKGKTIRVVSYDNRRYTNSAGTDPARRILTKTIRPVNDGVFVFDTQFDNKATATRRQSSRFWEEFCFAADWTFGYERVHSLDDVAFFLSKRIIPQPFIVFSGHGSDSRGWELSNGEALAFARTANGGVCIGACAAAKGRCKHGTDEEELCPSFRNLEIRKENEAKVLLFSSCLMGRNPRLCEGIKEALRATAVLAYSTPISDELCCLAEPQLLSLIAMGKKPGDAAELIRTNMDPWKTVISSGKKRYPLECF
jgi:hypothetical protein